MSCSMLEDEDPHAALYEMGDEDDEADADARPSALSVARIPALVREGERRWLRWLQSGM